MAHATTILSKEVAEQDPAMAAVFDAAAEVELARRNAAGYGIEIARYEAELAITPAGVLLATARDGEAQAKSQAKIAEEKLRLQALAYHAATGKAPFAGVDITSPANVEIDEEALLAWARLNAVHALDEKILVVSLTRAREYATKQGIALSGAQEVGLRARAENLLPWARDARRAVCTIKKNLGAFLDGLV